jgi:CheY-like chemotaxis protein
MKKKKIMLVEDEEDIAAVFGMVLVGGGYEVDSFTDPLLALKQFKSGSYDPVILDIKMPRMDGFELRRQIKRIDNAVKVCFITASELYYEEFRKELGLEEEVTIDKDRYLRKPIQNEQLIAEITRIINSN